jgi:hypothetical protein
VFSLPTIHYFFLASRFGVGYPFEKRGYSTCGIIIFTLKRSYMSREKSIKVRLSEYELQQLKQEAEKQGIGMSDFLRKYISKLPKPENFTAVKTA